MIQIFQTNITATKDVDGIKGIFIAPTENERTVMGMAKYIDREALIEWLKRIPLIDLSDGRGLCRVIMEDDFKKAIKKMPKGIIADVAQVRHGRWRESGPLLECQSCGEVYSRLVGNAGKLWNYCPNCGAKTDGGAENAVD